jgi:hypothetical protein
MLNCDIANGEKSIFCIVFNGGGFVSAWAFVAVSDPATV